MESKTENGTGSKREPGVAGEQAKDPDELEIRISYNKRTGKIGLEAPIADKINCFGMLKFAEMMIASAKPPSPAIMPVAKMPDFNKITGSPRQ